MWYDYINERLCELGRDSMEMPSEPEVVIVSTNGVALGTLPRSEAHSRPGILHLAVSLQVVDQEGRWILQQRSWQKRPFRGLWSNSCCTHPLPGEQIALCAARRIREELDLHVDRLEFAGTFQYRAEDPSTGLVEHELDNVYVGVATGAAKFSSEEVQDVAMLSYEHALELLDSEEGTPWASSVLALAWAHFEGT